MSELYRLHQVLESTFLNIQSILFLPLSAVRCLVGPTLGAKMAKTVIKDDILNTNIDTLTPVEALMKLNEIKKLLGNAQK